MSRFRPPPNRGSRLRTWEGSYGNAHLGTCHVAASYTRTKAPTSRELHMMKRFGQGHSRALFQQMRAAGGEMAWFEQQLEPDSIPQTATALAVPSWFPALRRSATTKRATDSDGSYNTYKYATDLANYTLQMRINSSRPLFETMVDFWSTHLHVNARDFPGFVQRYGYDEMLRENALGTFEDLLIAATTHPAMLMFLDNCESVRNTPNENHGRELLELHTVGRVSGYTETMVKDSAKILSGLDRPRPTTTPTTTRTATPPEPSASSASSTPTPPPTARRCRWTTCATSPATS